MRRLLFLFFFGVVLQSEAQVPKTVMVEHFTNTLCGVCANRNPGFYNWLSTQPEVLHIAYHPSSPYSACAFSQLNPEENDDRAYYYGVFGSTPRLVVNGTALSPSESYSDSATFAPFQGDSSAFSLQLDTVIYNANNDSFTVTVSVIAVSSHSLSELELFVAMAEKAVSYAAPNGENLHRDVFRKAFTPVEGTLVSNPPTLAGEEITYTLSIGWEPEWNKTQLEVIAVLNNPSNQEVVQAASTDQFKTIGSVGISQEEANSISIFPNPAKEHVSLSGLSELAKVTIYSLVGKPVLSQWLQQSTFSVSTLPEGVYILQVENKANILLRKRLLVVH